MSFSDFDKGTPSKPFCQRSKKAEVDMEMLARFHESERRLSILRSRDGETHTPTDREILRWLKTVEK
jgi:hypothetical protein